MSSRRNNIETGRMTSITRRIHGLWIREKLKRIFFEDLLIAIIMQIFFVISNAYRSYGDRFVSHYADKWREVEDMSGRDGFDGFLELISELFTAQSMRMFYIYMGIALGAMLVMQLLALLIEYPFDNKKIRKILRPINDIALKADELSRMAFDDEDKYRVIEDAISNLSPGDNEKLSFNNSDLQGVEAVR